jgi:hypothetical protein
MGAESGLRKRLRGVQGGSVQGSVQKQGAVDEDGHRVVPSEVTKQPNGEHDDGRQAEDRTKGAAAQGQDGARSGLAQGGRSGALPGAHGDGGR